MILCMDIFGNRINNIYDMCYEMWFQNEIYDI